MTLGYLKQLTKYTRPAQEITIKSQNDTLKNDNEGIVFEKLSFKGIV